MSGLGLVLAVLVSALLGFLAGFCAGLVPGLHMNNIAAAVVANAAASIAFFDPFSSMASQGMPTLLLSCFLGACMVAHMFSEALPSTYVGIPSEDVVSVLPAHRLAKAGVGSAAVVASAVGCLEGLLLGAIALFPVCLMMSPPLDLYGHIKKVMFPLIMAFCAVLLLSEGFPTLDFRKRVRGAWGKVLAGAAVFVISGLIGTVVLMTNYCACSVPDFPWIGTPFVSRSSLLLPMFAGLFGIPSLLLSLGSKAAPSSMSSVGPSLPFSPRPRDFGIGAVGGLIVGWMPGMTSGSAVTLCSPRTAEHEMGSDIQGSLRFIWLYSVVSSSGAVFALGALFVISRARSGTMEAVKGLLGANAIDASRYSDPLPLVAILIAMFMAALLSFVVLTRCEAWLLRSREVLSSKRLAVVSMAFVVLLSVWLTGTRGALLMVACASLGLFPPLVGVRRIQLMGCLLVPVGLLFLQMMI